MSLTIHWSDSLEKLAEAMFAQDGVPADPFQAEAVVVGGAAIEGWLKQRYLLDRPPGGRSRPLLANCAFSPLHPFVNDWLAKAVDNTPVGRRDPAGHPYSKAALQWRIYALLEADPARFAPLARYVGDAPASAARRRWGLSGRLAQLFDDYQNYRSETLDAWKHGRRRDGDAGLEWQGDLWRALLAEHPRSYADEFLDVARTGALRACGISERYRRISVFHVSAMPKAYLDFFAQIAAFMPVSLFCFNPSRAFWIEDPSVKGYLRDLARSGEAPMWIEPPHPLLNSFGRGVQSLLADVLDLAEGQVNAEDWGEDADDSLLHRVQRGIRDKEPPASAPERGDDSIQLHACHGALREVQVARDAILTWFEEHPGSQPRDVQVLAADFERYAPFIESVFRIGDPAASPPCAMSRRPAASAGAIGAAFIRLLRLPESRMTAPEIMELLEIEPVREARDLSAADVQALRRRVAEAGVRWGADGEHVAALVGAAGVPDTATWRRGLDRLLAGWAHGRADTDGGALIDAGALGPLRADDAVESDSARRVGQLGAFFDALVETADALSRPRRASEWKTLLGELLDTFFRSTESSFGEIAEIRRVLRSAASAAAVAGDPQIPGDVMATAIEAELGAMAPAGNCAANAVLVSPLQTLQATPRKLIVLLGLNEGAFPRADNRPDFDLLGRKPRHGDRSLRREDRLAFLEALMAARERLVMVYTGRGISDNAEIPPSPAVTELLQHLGQAVVPVVHRLHAFHPDNFAGRGPLRSFSRADYDAAAALAQQSRGGAATPVAAPVPAPAPAAPEDPVLSLADLQMFFTNPAKAFYTQTLQTRLDDPERDQLADSESFEVGTLEAYFLKDRLVATRLDSDGETLADSVQNELQELGMVPLGLYGRKIAQQAYDGVVAQLATSSKFLGRPYRDILRDLRDMTPTGAVASVAAREIVGELPLVQQDGAAFAVHFRNATIRPKTLVPAWIAHLLGHAAGLRFATIVIGSAEGNKLEEVVMPPMAPDQAQAVLAELIALLAEGQMDALPFAPATSEAFAAALRPKKPKAPKKGKPPPEPTPPPTEAEALAKTEGVWNAFSLPESGDTYFAAAWGDAGPMAHPAFPRVATTFWTPCLDAIEAAEAGGTP